MDGGFVEGLGLVPKQAGLRRICPLKHGRRQDFRGGGGGLVLCSGQFEDSENGAENEKEKEEDDVWKRLLDGMKERIVGKMKVEMEQASAVDYVSGKDDGVREQSVEASGVSGTGDNGQEDDSVEDSENGRAAEESEDEEKSFEIWEKVLESKLRQLVENDEAEGDGNKEAEHEREEYFSLEKEASDLEVEKFASDEVDIDDVLDGIQASELKEELDQSMKSVQNDGDVRSLVGKVYDRFAKNRKDDSRDSSSRKNGNMEVSDPTSQNDVPRTNAIYERIKVLDPNNSAHLSKLITSDANKAMVKALNAILGNLPEPLFELTIQTDRDGLGQLLFTAEVTGYFLRDGEIKFSRSKVTGEEPDEEGEEEESDEILPEPGTEVESNISGKLSWWDPARNERVQISPASYIQRLEAEIEILQEQADAIAAKGGGEQSARLLEYASFVRDAPISAKLSDLSAEATEAMQRVVNTLLGRSNSQVQQSYTTGREYVAHLFRWCMMVGYHVRDVESRIELDALLADD